jgi:class 3 adenylate cyclase
MSSSPEARAPRELVIVFLDLSSYTMDARCTADDARLADIIDGYYERVATHAREGSGTVVKFIGDGALLVFPPDKADDALRALLDLKSDVDAWLTKIGWSSRLVVKAHCGTVVAGGFGPKGEKKFDVIGDEVNVTARLQTRSFGMTAQVFRQLSPESRKRFKKHTPPILYIPIEDKRPSNVAKWG